MRVLLTILLLLPASALAFERVTTRDAFVSTVEGKRLTGGGVGLVVSRQGGISGRAFGFRVTGGWTWENGLFCRTINTAVRKLPRNCQTVALRGDILRFQADQGTGDVADLTLR